jgi:hypothetical protein
MTAGACSRRGCSPHGSQEAKQKREEGAEVKIYLQGHKPKYLLPSARSHLLDFHHFPVNLSIRAIMIQLLLKSPTSELCCIGDQAFNA